MNREKRLRPGAWGVRRTPGEGYDMPNKRRAWLWGCANDGGGNCFRQTIAPLRRSSPIPGECAGCVMVGIEWSPSTLDERALGDAECGLICGRRGYRK